MRVVFGAILVAATVVGLACTSQPTPTPTPVPPPPAKPAASPAQSPAASPAVAPSPSPTALRGMVVVTANEADRSLSVVDVAAARVVSTIALDRPPHRIDMTADARLAGVSDNSRGSREVMLADIAAGRKLADVSVGSQPDGVGLLPSATELVVANSGDNSVSDIDLNARSVSGTISVGTRPRGLVVVSPAAPTGGPAPLPAASPAPAGSPSPAVSPVVSASPRPGQAAAKAFVANEDAGSVSVIDLSTRQVTSTVDVGGRPTRLAASRDGTRVYVLNEDSNSVDVVDAGSAQRQSEIRVGPNLTDVAATPDGKLLFVTANDPAHNLYKIDLASGRVVQDFSVLGGGGATPSASPAAAASPAVSPAASPGASPSPAAAGPGALAVRAGTDSTRVYVTTTEDKLVVWDVDANRAASTVAVGRRPVDLAFGVAPTPGAPAPSPAVQASPAIAPAPAVSPAASPSAAPGG